MIDLKTVQIFNSGCLNSDSQYVFTRVRRIRLCCALTAIILFSKYDIPENKTLAFVFCDLHKKILEPKSNYVSHATALNPLTIIRSKRTITSHLCLNRRLRLIVKAIAYYLKLKPNGDLARWLEFVFFYSLISKYAEIVDRQNNVIEIASTTDRYITWIAGLANQYCIRVVAYQHGTLLHFAGLPVRVKIDEFHVYNEKEKEVIKQRIVKNENCVFIREHFTTQVSFEIYEREDNEPLFGIVSQHDYNFNILAIDTLSKVFPKSRIILMLHPFETNIAQYQILLKSYQMLVIDADRKYINFDYVILKNSTMIYDYLYSSYHGIIFVIGNRGIYGDIDKRIIYLDSIVDITKEVISSGS